MSIRFTGVQDDVPEDKSAIPRAAQPIEPTEVERDQRSDLSIVCSRERVCWDAKP
jgi:hypothetical protein